MTSHDTFTSETSQVVTVASLQQLKMTVLIPAPADSECTEHSTDRNSSSAVPGLWPHTARRSTHLLQEFCCEVFNHHPPFSPDLAPSDFHLFLHLKKFLLVSVGVFRMTEKRR